MRRRTLAAAAGAGGRPSPPAPMPRAASRWASRRVRSPTDSAVVWGHSTRSEDGYRRVLNRPTALSSAASGLARRSKRVRASDVERQHGPDAAHRAASRTQPTTIASSAGGRRAATPAGSGPRRGAEPGQDDRVRLVRRHRRSEPPGRDQAVLEQLRGLRADGARAQRLQRQLRRHDLLRHRGRVRASRAASSCRARRRR